MTKREQKQLTQSIKETVAVVRESKKSAQSENLSFEIDNAVSLFDELGVNTSTKKKKKLTSLDIIVRLFFIIALCICLLSLYKITIYFIDEFNAQATQRQIQHRYTVVAQHKNMAVPENNKNNIVNLVKPLILTETAKELLEINPDTVGYIKLPGTGINGTVVQGTDDEYYLDHDIHGNPNQGGTLFVDSRATIGTHYDSPNLIIYGHNQKDGTMFGDMDFFRWNPEFWKESPVIYFNTNYEDRKYLIIASFVTNEQPQHDNGFVFDYWNYIYFNDDFPFEEWKSEVLDRTTFFTGYDFDDTDQYITLSTCSTEWEPSRHVIIARMLRDGETENNIDTSNWRENENPRWPQVWYDYHGGGSWERSR